MYKHEVVMSFPWKKWDDYGRYCLPSFDKRWPQSATASVYLDGEKADLPYKPSDRVSITDFDDINIGTRIKAFEERNAHRTEIFDLSSYGDIGKQAVKFARKAYAQIHSLENPKARYVWWIDADLYTKVEINDELLDVLTPAPHYLGCLRRKKINKYTECGFIMWDTQHPSHQKWLDLYKSCYDNDKIFEFDAWHDCIAFDYATDTLLESKDISIVDFSYGIPSSHPLETGPLGRYFDHKKGKRKFESHQRYVKIDDLTTEG